MPDMPSLIISGQGLAGTCVAFACLEKEIPFQIVDSGVAGSSVVAAGMINPITGKNFQPSWLIDRFYPEAVRFFQKFEEKFGVIVWNPLPIQRLASSEKEWRKIERKISEPEVTPWLAEDNFPCPKEFIGAVTLHGGGWIDTKVFLRVAREHFQKIGAYTEATSPSTAAKNRIRCEGATGLMTQQLGEHRCAKGEILTVSASWNIETIRIGSGGWLIPIGGGEYRIGSTYEWDELDSQPSEKGLARIREITEKLGGSSYQIIDHVAGIRPIIRRSQPLIGKDRNGEWVMNGLGSKGTLYAPSMALMLVDWISEGIIPDEEFILTISS